MGGIQEVRLMVRNLANTVPLDVALVRTRLDEIESCLAEMQIDEFEAAKSKADHAKPIFRVDINKIQDGSIYCESSPIPDGIELIHRRGEIRIKAV